ncbi:MAG: DUF4296 domain-containing protein [Balneolaceae bacterium]
MKTLKYLLPLLLLIFAACEDELPEGVLAEDTYTALFSELLVVDRISDNQLGSVNRQHLIDEIYEEHNATEEEFRISHHYYQQQPERQLQRIDEIHEFVSSERDTIQASLRKYEDDIRARERAEADSLEALDQESDN